MTETNSAMTTPSTGEHTNELEAKLVKAGVFKGMHGLEGLYNASAFWEQQMYGTRLHYGDGIADYLHRDVLGSAIEILKQPTQDVSALSRIQSLEAALETASNALSRMAIHKYCAKDGAGRAETDKSIREAFEQVDRAIEKIEKSRALGQKGDV